MQPADRARTAWWRRGAIYQIYPRSFADSNGDGAGDLPGITAHLDYLNNGTQDSLGVEAIWLSPFYVSPMADFGYDVADYCDVDPIFGTLEDFDELVEESHRRGIRVVVDFVPNHTSDQHPWFQESRSSRDNRKRDWYVWRDGRDGGPPNNWPSTFKAVGGAWTFDEHTGQWYLHSFLPQQPDLNWENDDVREAMHDVMRFWLNRGVDGFRIDVVQKLAKDPRLSDATPGRPVPWEDWQPTIHERLRDLRAVVDEYPERMLVGEVYLFDVERLVAYVNSGDELHLAHNFVFLHLPWDAAAFRAAIDGFEALSTEAAWPAWFLANHDHPRVASRFNADGNGQLRAREVLLMLYALRGTPFIYQGEELGLPDADIPRERIVDVDGRDPERAPIPWKPPSEAGPGAGFTTGEPWLPIVSGAEELSVVRQEADPESTLSLTKRIAALRRERPALHLGEQRSMDAGPDLLSWMCLESTTCRLGIVNFAAEERRFHRTRDVPERGRLDVSTLPGRDAELRGKTVDLTDFSLGPCEAVLLSV
jgi:alpha-glucosidase